MKPLQQAVILAGGRGTRLRPLTNTVPKPMIKIHGKPFLEYLIELLKKNDVTDILILTGYLGDQIRSYFQSGKKWGVHITYHDSPLETDTGLRIKNAKQFIKDEFLLLYGDNYWPLDIKKHLALFREKNVSGMVTIYSNPDGYTKNNIYVNEENMVEIYDKQRTSEKLNGVDIGFFIIKKEILNLLPRTNSHFELEVLPKLIKKKQLAGFLTYHKYYGLSNLKRIPVIKKHLKLRKIILLDRDGVINKKMKKAQYVTKWKEFELLPGTIDALKLLTDNKYEIYIITNQAGIGRGIMTEKDLHDIHTKFLSMCLTENIKIKHIYHCPHKWDEGCFCRKPQPGMLYQAASDHHFDLTKALFIGDDMRDGQTGTAAGCRTIILHKGQRLLDIVNKLV